MNPSGKWMALYKSTSELLENKYYKKVEVKFFIFLNSIVIFLTYRSEGDAKIFEGGQNCISDYLKLSPSINTLNTPNFPQTE